MLIRGYVPADDLATYRLFQRAIRETARHDYTSEQIEAWASARDLDGWGQDRGTANTRVAQIDEAIAGFTDVTADGHIDMLFVDPLFVRRGVATALLTWATDSARASGATELSTFASITARRFFAAQGFTVTEERHPTVRGVSLANFRMVRPIT